MSYKNKEEIIERWETPIVEAFLPGISTVQRDSSGVSAYIHGDSGPAYEFYFEAIAFRTTNEKSALYIPTLSSPIGCTAICRNSKWIEYLAKEAAALSMGHAAKKSTHYVFYGGTWTFEVASLEAPVIDKLDQLPSFLRDVEL